MSVKKPKEVLLPKSVKVGAWTYQIRPMDGDIDRTGRHTGFCDNNRRIIHVSVQCDYKEGAATLLHEIIHAIFCRFGFKEDDSEERIVEVVEEGLHCVHIDNPEIMAWIWKGIRSGSH